MKAIERGHSKIQGQGTPYEFFLLLLREEMLVAHGLFNRIKTFPGTAPSRRLTRWWNSNPQRRLSLAMSGSAADERHLFYGLNLTAGLRPPPNLSAIVKRHLRNVTVIGCYICNRKSSRIFSYFYDLSLRSNAYLLLLIILLENFGVTFFYRRVPPFPPWPPFKGTTHTATTHPTPCLRPLFSGAVAQLQRSGDEEETK